MPAVLRTRPRASAARRRRRRRRHDAPTGAAVFLATLAAYGCGGESEHAPRTTARPFFTEVTRELGLGRDRSEWPRGRYRIPEISAGGIALFDCDGDADLDIYRVCHPSPDDPEAPAPNELYLQETGGAFRAEPGAGGLDDAGFGNGVAIGDVDGDGDPDVYVANLGRDALHLNDGAGRFTDVTASWGIDEDAWSSSAAFLDYDRDGDLDLYVARYLVDDPSRVCRTTSEGPQDYCGPSRYRGVADVLYRNEAGSGFMDVTARAGIRGERPGFGVLAADLTGDGWLDIYVANDKKPNFLWVNQRDGTFRDEGMERGVAVNGAGSAEASMGVAAGDADRDGRLDILLTHLEGETHTLYLQKTPGRFIDRSASSGLGAPTLAFTGWGCGLADLDHDGDLDIAAVHGRVARGKRYDGARCGAFWDDYAEPNALFLGELGGATGVRFARADPHGGAFTRHVEPSRGLAFGDLDGDGDIDLVETDVGGRLRVYRNDAPDPAARWLAVRALVGASDALGAEVAVEIGGVRLVRLLATSYSFASASEPVARFGLGSATGADAIEVRWPDGRRERFPGATAGRVVTVRHGTGRAPPAR